MSDTITIDIDEYEELKRDSDFLNALYNAGVDNWSGYEYAQDLFRENRNA